MGHWLQIASKNGKDAFWLAIYVSYGGGVIAGLAYGLFCYFTGESLSTVLVIGALLSSVLASINHFFVVGDIRQTAKEAYHAVLRGLRNPQETRRSYRAKQIRSGLGFCLIFAGLGMLVKPAAAGSIYILADLLTMYLVATTPLHPNEVERRKVPGSAQAARASL